MHAPLWQVCEPLQATQARPSTPHALLEVPPTQVEPEQQPAQVCAQPVAPPPVPQPAEPPPAPPPDEPPPLPPPELLGKWQVPRVQTWPPEHATQATPLAPHSLRATPIAQLPEVSQQPMQLEESQAFFAGPQEKVAPNNTAGIKNDR